MPIHSSTEWQVIYCAPEKPQLQNKKLYTDFGVSTNYCDVALNRESKLNIFCQTKFFVQNTMYNAFAIVIPRLLEYKSDIGNDIQSVSSKNLGISNQKNRGSLLLLKISQHSELNRTPFLQNTSVFYCFCIS